MSFDAVFLSRLRFSCVVALIPRWPAFTVDLASSGRHRGVFAAR